MSDSPLRVRHSPLAGTLSIISLHRLVQLSASVATVVVVPRLLGVEDYGRFSFILSLLYLGHILGDFGTTDVFARFVPGMTHPEASRLFMHMVAFKILVGLSCGLITMGGALVLAGWMRPAWAALAGLSVAIHIVAWVPFQFALGIKRIGVWMTELAWRQWVLLLLLLPLYPLLSMNGALLALVIMEVVFCALGLWWLRSYWQVAALRLDWAYLLPYVRFATGFFLANIAAVALYRSGPILVETLSGDVAQAGYINLAIGLFLMAYVTISQFAQSLMPTLSGFRVAGQMDEVRRWLGDFMRIWLLLGGLAALAIWLLADRLAPLIFGPEFGPVAAVLKWISLGIPLAALQWAGNVLATVTGRGRVKFAASLAALLVFGVAAGLFTPAHGAAGTAAAISLAVLAHVAVLLAGLRPDFDLGAIRPASKASGG